MGISGNREIEGRSTKDKGRRTKDKGRRTKDKGRRRPNTFLLRTSYFALRPSEIHFGIEEQSRFGGAAELAADGFYRTQVRALPQDLRTQAHRGRDGEVLLGGVRRRADLQQ